LPNFVFVFENGAQGAKRGFRQRNSFFTCTYPNGATHLSGYRTEAGPPQRTEHSGNGPKGSNITEIPASAPGLLFFGEYPPHVRVRL